MSYAREGVTEKTAKKAPKKKEEMTKAELIQAEKRRLTKFFKKIEPEKQGITTGLIERAAFMRISLDEMEIDLLENGFTELFSQGDQEPYDRKRPVVDAYNQLNNGYPKVIKQLVDLLPKEDLKKGETDEFEVFVIGEKAERGKEKKTVG